MHRTRCVGLINNGGQSTRNLLEFMSKFAGAMELDDGHTLGNGTCTSRSPVVINYIYICVCVIPLINS